MKKAATSKTQKSMKDLGVKAESAKKVKGGIIAVLNCRKAGGDPQ